jgi:hypothetical protein
MHEKILQTNPAELESPQPNNPYELFAWWIGDILLYGILAVFVYFDLFIITGNWKWYLLPLAIGIIRWLWLDTIENSVKAIKGKK